MIVLNDTVLKYFLALSFSFGIVIPWMIKLVSDFVAYKSESVKRIVECLNSNLAHMDMKLVLGYSFYFVLGYFLDRTELKNVFEL